MRLISTRFSLKHSQSRLLHRDSITQYTYICLHKDFLRVTTGRAMQCISLYCRRPRYEKETSDTFSKLRFDVTWLVLLWKHSAETLQFFGGRSFVARYPYDSWFMNFWPTRVSQVYSKGTKPIKINMFFVYLDILTPTDDEVCWPLKPLNIQKTCRIVSKCINFVLLLYI